MSTTRTRAQKVRTHRLKARLGFSNLRLTSRDRTFLGDLSRVSIIDEPTASTVHYSANKSGAKIRLGKLIEAGILKKQHIVDPSRGRVVVYTFATDRAAMSFGGRVLHIGGNRSIYHELLVSRTYFDLNRPADFRTAIQFEACDLARFSARIVTPRQRSLTTHHGFLAQAAIPDALYTSATGELVIVEADSGHYTTRQIQQKQIQWRDYRQVWAQPRSSHAQVQPDQQISVIKY